MKVNKMEKKNSIIFHRSNISVRLFLNVTDFFLRVKQIPITTVKVGLKARQEQSEFACDAYVCH